MYEDNTIALHAGDWEAQVAPSMGMNVISLTWQGQPVLRSPETWEDFLKDSCVYGTPILLPPNRTEGGTFPFDGRQYDLGINEPAFHNHLHGRMHCQEFKVTEVSGTKLSGVFENRGEVFPFPFRMEVSCYLVDTGLLQEFLITNTGESDMPLTFGLHTVFACPGDIRVPIEKRWTVNDCYIPTGSLEELTKESQCFHTGTNPHGKLVRGFYTSAGNVARIGDFSYRVSGGFDQWVLWNGDGNSGFCAIEPMQGAVNALNSGTGLLRLKRGERKRFATAICRAE